MIVGLLLSPLALATSPLIIKPVTIAIANDDEAKITLSAQDINRVFVVGDKIVSLDAPHHRVIAHNDASGSLLMNVIGQEPFTVFLTTAHGRHFSLWVLPKSEPGVTVRFLPTTTIIHTVYPPQHTARHVAHADQKTWVNLLRDVMLSKIPPGYTRIDPPALNTVSVFQLPRMRKMSKTGPFLEERVQAGFLGGALALRIVRLTNTGKKPIAFKPRDFYTRGVKALALEKETLAPQESTNLYEVLRNV